MNASVANETYDLIGIGFGPSNLSVAIQAKELGFFDKSKIQFLEKKDKFSWHPDMLLPNSYMQIHFLKDLISLDNPQSKYTFINFLKTNDRLLDFINQGISYPTRIEFNQYMRWVASDFDDFVRYSTYVKDIRPIIIDGKIDSFRLTVVGTDDSSYEIVSRNVILASGKSKKIPREFTNLKSKDQNVIHSSGFLSWIEKCKEKLDNKTLSVIGGGQSAGEIFSYLLSETSNSTKIINYISTYGYNPSDSSGFNNKLFDPEFIDFFYDLDKESQKEFLSRHKNTNYAVVEPELIENIYRALYNENKVEGKNRAKIVNMSRIISVEEDQDGFVLSIMNTMTKEVSKQYVDIIVLATGYEDNFVLDKYFYNFKNLANLDACGKPIINRNYSVNFKIESEATLYLQGYAEESHGLAESLLSVLPIRAKIILDHIYKGKLSECNLQKSN
ncbi:lysine N(6)-hydroxylase/L-ornithine N(5)-oxygenase family protein [Leptospira alexanderi]|uniref:L-ornithine 5-monooxygenase n=1 Tax=Leptospira alexanderi serovar Manhao 3 str. L 60 TaxID=1049759 RepID=V6I9V9_9LEPT|nr:SidA/IucD/PvdA family monooxygenase [Leptospira alexanderi]EQA64609.1 putative L-ornithine 5-monooxygenase [Leptospira alexanderi serovar Manhao 3 str. L 60]